MFQILLMAFVNSCATESFDGQRGHTLRFEAVHKSLSIRMRPDRTHRRRLWRSYKLKFAEALYLIPPLGAFFASGM